MIMATYTLILNILLIMLCLNDIIGVCDINITGAFLYYFLIFTFIFLIFLFYSFYLNIYIEVIAERHIYIFLCICLFILYILCSIEYKLSEATFNSVFYVNMFLDLELIKVNWSKEELARVLEIHISLLDMEGPKFIFETSELNRIVMESRNPEDVDKKFKKLVIAYENKQSWFDPTFLFTVFYIVVAGVFTTSVAMYGISEFEVMDTHNTPTIYNSDIPSLPYPRFTPRGPLRISGQMDIGIFPSTFRGEISFEHILNFPHSVLSHTVTRINHVDYLLKVISNVVTHFFSQHQLYMYELLKILAKGDYPNKQQDIQALLELMTNDGYRLNRDIPLYRCYYELRMLAFEMNVPGFRASTFDPNEPQDF